MDPLVIALVFLSFFILGRVIITYSVSKTLYPSKHLERALTWGLFGSFGILFKSKLIKKEDVETFKVPAKTIIKFVLISCGIFFIVFKVFLSRSFSNTDDIRSLGFLIGAVLIILVARIDYMLNERKIKTGQANLLHGSVSKSYAYIIGLMATVVIIWYALNLFHH